MRTDQGLTLIELLIVIVILGILSAIIVFSVDGITNRGEGASCEASAQTVRIASETFRANDPQTNHAASLDALLTSGFLAGPLPGTVTGNTIALAGGNIVYNPANGSVTDTCTSGGTGGGPSAQVPAGGSVVFSYPTGTTTTNCGASSPCIEENDPLVATTSGWSNSPTSYTFQWQQSVASVNQSGICDGAWGNYGAPVTQAGTSHQITTENVTTDRCYRVIITATNGDGASPPLTTAHVYAT